MQTVIRDGAAVRQSLTPKPQRWCWLRNAADFRLVTNWPPFQVCLNFTIYDAAAMLRRTISCPHPPSAHNKASAFDCGHICYQQFLFSRGNKLPAPAAAIDWKVVRQPQTENTNSQNCLWWMFCFPFLNCSTFFQFFSPFFPDTCADIYTNGFQVGAIFKIKKKRKLFSAVCC